MIKLTREQELELQRNNLITENARLNGLLNEALGALGYSVPSDTPCPPRYQCGICASRNVERHGPGSREYEIEQAKRAQPYKGYQP